MTTQEAFNIVVQASRSINANADVHDKVREALVTLSKALFPTEPVAEGPTREAPPVSPSKES